MENLKSTLKQLHVSGYSKMSRDKCLETLASLVVKQNGNTVALKNEDRCIVADILELI